MNLSIDNFVCTCFKLNEIMNLSLSNEQLSWISKWN